MLRIILISLLLVSSAFASPKFLTISDIHYGNQNVSRDGQDTGDEFFAITLNKFNELIKDVDFILNLGDIPTHHLFITSQKEEDEKVVFHGLFTANNKAKPMFYITGNNDSLGGNYQPFEYQGKSPLSFAPEWQGACANCDGLIIDDTHMYHEGYYSSYVMPGNTDIMLIALNTVEWTKTPVLLPKYPNQEQVAYVQLLWLEQQLKNHHAKQLLIAMHVPPGKIYNGTSLWHHRYLQKFIELLEKYHPLYGQITLLTSHTHMDEFRKIKLSNGLNIYGYSTPAISRIHHNNPGMKVFSLDKNMQIQDFITYYTSALNEWGNEMYHALGNPDAIFPECHIGSLVQCLNIFDTEQVCSALDDGLFYSVKSPRVIKTGCENLYLVN